MWARDWQTFNGPTHLLLHANTKLRRVSSKLWYTTSQTHWRNSAKEFLFTQSQRGIQKIVKLLEEARKITEENQDYAAVYTFGKKLILLISEKLSSIDEYSVLVKSCPIQTGETASSLQSSFKDKWLGFISLSDTVKMAHVPCLLLIWAPLPHSLLALLLLPPLLTRLVSETFKYSSRYLEGLLGKSNFTLSPFI